MMRCAHFYHCWADGQWRVPVEEHIEALTSSGFDGPITVGLVGTPANRAEARDVFEQSFGQVRFVEAERGHEEHTLRLIHAHAKGGADGAVMYAHTHGAWHSRNATDRIRITRGLVAGWAHCLDLLADPQIDLIGYKYLLQQKRSSPWGELVSNGVILKGNFWCAKCDYLRLLGPAPRMPTTNDERCANETWILADCTLSPRPYSLWPEEPTEEDLTRHVPASFKEQLVWRDGAWEYTPEALATLREEDARAVF